MKLGGDEGGSSRNLAGNIFGILERANCAPTPIPVFAEWQAAHASMMAAGFKQVPSFNPYWESRGRTYEDADGYRIVLEQAEWRNVRIP